MMSSGEARFEEVLHRDLSSPLDIIPAGADELTPDGLDEAIAALTSAYPYVVLHASDWRAEPALAALEHSSELVLAARPDRLERALGQAREILRELPIALRVGRSRQRQGGRAGGVALAACEMCHFPARFHDFRELRCHFPPPQGPPHAR